MSTVAILGTDALGGALAHSLARRNRIKRIRLIDPATGTAKGTALDIQQAGAVERFDTHLATGRIDSLIGASVVVMATPSSEHSGRRHELAVACFTAPCPSWESKIVTSTAHAPHPPSPHPTTVSSR